MSYLAKFEKNVLNDEKTFLMFMSLYPENVKAYISEFKSKFGDRYLDEPQIQKIWKYYTDTLDSNGLINEKYIRDSILAYNQTIENSNASYELVFDVFEVNYLIFGSYTIDNDLLVDKLFNENKNIIKFPIAKMFLDNIFSVENFNVLKKEFKFCIPENMTLINYFEINQGFLNILPKIELIDGLKLYLNRSELPLYDLKDFIFKYSESEEFLSGNVVIQAFYSIVCEENGLDYLLSLETILDDGEVKEDENRSVLYHLFLNNIVRNRWNSFDSKSEKENLLKVFFELNSNEQFKEFSYTLNKLDKLLFESLIGELKKDPNLSLKLSYMTINNLNKEQFKIIFSLKDQIDLIDVNDTNLFFMEKADELIYGTNIFNSDNFYSLLTNKSYADFIVILGSDFIRSTRKLHQLFKYLNKNIDYLFTKTNDGKNERYQLKDSVIDSLISFQKDCN